MSAMSAGANYFQRFKRYVRLSLLGIELSGEVCRAALMVRIVPFRRYSQWLRQSKGTQPASVHLARDIRRIVELLARLLPERSRCLICAIAARRVLERRGYRSELALGVDPSGEAITAHAWLTAETIIVTGRDGKDSFNEIARF